MAYSKTKTYDVKLKKTIEHPEGNFIRPGNTVQLRGDVATKFSDAIESATEVVEKKG